MKHISKHAFFVGFAVIEIVLRPNCRKDTVKEVS